MLGLKLNHVSKRGPWKSFMAEPIPKMILEIDGIPPKAPYPPCLRMADRALLAGYPRNVVLKMLSRHQQARYWPTSPGIFWFLNVRNFPDDILKHFFFFTENVWISNTIRPKFVPKGPIDRQYSIVWDNGFAQIWQQAIIWTNDGLG